MDLGSVLMGTGGGGLLTAAFTTFVTRRKLGADTASVLTKAASGLVEDLRKELDRLSAKVSVLETEVTGLKQRERALVDELDAAHDLNRQKDDLIAAFTREQQQKES